MERAAAGEEILVTHRGRPRIRVAPASRHASRSRHDRAAPTVEQQFLSGCGSAP